MAKDDFDSDFDFEKELGFNPNDFLDSDVDADIDFSQFGEEEPGADVSGKTLLLIDDIVTTGATLSECCRVLKGAGAARVACAAFASPRNENER